MVTNLSGIRSWRYFRGSLSQPRAVVPKFRPLGKDGIRWKKLRCTFGRRGERTLFCEPEHSHL